MASPLLHIEPPAFPIEPRSAVLLKELSRKSLQAGITSASHLEIRPAPETASSGIPQIDALTGGLPRGCLTEVSGPASSGRTSLLLSALTAATRREEICTLIDASDAFDPHSATAAGLNLERLLWIRCGSHTQSSALARKRRPASSLAEWERRRMEDPVEQALRATNLLLQSSGFGLVAIDLAGVPFKMAHRIPLTTWFRFRRAVENTPTVLLVIGTEPCTQSCASLSLKLSLQSPVGRHQSSVASRQETLRSKEVFDSEEVLSERSSSNDDRDRNKDNRNRNTKEFPAERPTHAELFTGIEIQTEVLRSRNDRKPVQSASTFATKTAWTA
jgi:hypothetical protein